MGDAVTTEGMTDTVEEVNESLTDTVLGNSTEGLTNADKEKTTEGLTNAAEGKPPRAWPMLRRRQPRA